MKRRIFLIAIFIILTTVGVLAYTQFDNIIGVIYSFKYSNNEIESLLEQNNETLKNELEEVIGHPIRDFTDEEIEQINNGTATKKEIIEKIIYEELEKSLELKMGKNAVSHKNANSADSETADSNNESVQSLNPEDSTGMATTKNSISKTSDKTETQETKLKNDVKEKSDTSNENLSSESVSSDVSANYYIMELYSLKGEYIGMLDGMVSSAISEYKNLDKKEQTRSKQLEIGASYASKASALEQQCDSEVSAILKRLEAELIKEGKSTSIISTIRSSYTTEKKLKRAYYLNMFK